MTNQYEQQKMSDMVLRKVPQQDLHVCPQCGHCPTCGRPQYVPNYWWPYQLPYVPRRDVGPPYDEVQLERLYTNASGTMESNEA